MLVVWIVLGLVIWTALSVAAGVVIGRLIAGGHRRLVKNAADEEQRDRAEAA